MLALSCLTAGLVPHVALRTQPLLQAQPLRVARRAPPPQAAAESAHLATTVQLGVDSQVVSDTLLDVGVYGLLALTVGLTLYSVFVTLDEANNKAGGWTKPTDEPVVEDDPSSFRKNMVYNPVSNEWMPRAESDLADTTSAGGGGDGGDSNRYARRAEKREKTRGRKKR